MKLTELRPCDKCEGQIIPVVYKVKIQQGLVNARVVRSQIGAVEMMGGNLTIADALGLVDEPAVTFPGIGDTEIVLCQNCCLELLGELMQKRIDSAEKKESEA